MTHANPALNTPRIDVSEILDLTLKRETLSALKRRHDEMAGIVEALEQALIAKIDQGAELPTDFGALIKHKEVRHVSWKTEFAALAGSSAVDNVLAKTEPTVYRHLVIKKSGVRSTYYA